MPINRAKHWTPEDDIALIALTGVPGLTLREIAIHMGRTEAAVSCRLTIVRKAAPSTPIPQVS